MALASLATDALGVTHPVAGGAARIVSLVPSITELLCDLDLRDAIVGRTGFCIHPRASVRTIPKVGGTKDVNIDRIRALAPTHVIVNIEENRRADFDALAQFVPHVVVTYPRAPADNVGLYRLLGAIFDRASTAAALVDRFDAALRQASAATRSLPLEHVLYLIWRDPWMAVGPRTYIARTLAAVGWSVPESAEDYPRVDLAAAARAADRVLVSSEPYRFTDEHLHEIESIAGKPAQRIDGEMASWYGSRAIAGLAYLAGLRRSLSA